MNEETKNLIESFFSGDGMKPKYYAVDKTKTQKHANIQKWLKGRERVKEMRQNYSA